MNNRLTIQDLAGLLAEYTGKDRLSCERFLREFIAVVSEGVYADKIVKVKGLGTFKIIPVEKRESIHVNTGERFLIPPHYKFSFLPDKDLRELVNKPFSFFETTELNENVDFNDMDVVPDEPEMKETEDESVEEVIPEEKHLPEKETAAPPEEEEVGSPEEEEAGSPEEEAESEKHRSERLPDIKQESPEEERVSVMPEKRLPAKRIFFVAAFVFFLIAFNIGLYLNRSHFFEKEDTPSPVKREETVGSRLTSQADSSATVIDTAVVSTGQDCPQALIAQEAEEEAKTEAASPEVIARVKIEPGSRLTLISLKYYGSKLFWVYLYEYNKAVIKDPNNVPIGTVIEVPAPEKYGIDRRNRSSIEKAAARQTEILSGKL